MARVTAKFVVGGTGGGTPVLETPTGTINGSNVTFTLTGTPIASTLELFLDGIAQFSTAQYSITGTTITMVAAPAAGQDIKAVYRK